MQNKRLIFATTISSTTQIGIALMLAESVGRFGGQLKDSPFWIFYPDSLNVPAGDSENVKFIPFSLDEPFNSYLYSHKVYAAAAAEKMAKADNNLFIWLDNAAICLRPLELMVLDSGHDISLRTVHIQNIGCSSNEAYDDFWQEVFNRVGVKELPEWTMETYVDMKGIRPYLNCQAYSIKPSLGILEKWWNNFTELVSDNDFQKRLCPDEQHRIFLHQAVFTAGVIKDIRREKILFLPPEYWYPFHMHDELRAAGRSLTAREAVSVLTHGQKPDLEHDFYNGLADSATAWLTDKLSV